MPNGVGGIFGPARAFQPAVNEELEQIESQCPKQQNGQDGIRRMPEDMSKIPVLDPLVEGGVFNVPSGANDLQRRAAGHVAGPFTDDSEAPCCRGFVRFGDHGTDHADLSFISVERIDFIGIPKLDVFFRIRIGVILAGRQRLP